MIGIQISFPCHENGQRPFQSFGLRRWSLNLHLLYVSDELKQWSLLNHFCNVYWCLYYFQQKQYGVIADEVKTMVKYLSVSKSGVIGRYPLPISLVSVFNTTQTVNIFITSNFINLAARDFYNFGQMNRVIQHLERPKF